MAVKNLNQNEFENHVLKDDKLVLVDFFATWCMPCKMLGPVLEGVSGKVEDYAKIVKIDVDENTDLARKYGVMSIPTMILIKDGKEIDRLMGFRQEQQIIEVLEKNK